MYNLLLPIYVLFYLRFWTDYAECVLLTVSSRQLSDWPTAECLPRTVLYDAFYSYLCRRYWNGILGPSKFNLENKINYKTSMHSSRMRAACLLPVSPSMHCSQEGGCLPLVLGWWVSASGPGGWGCASQHALGQIPLCGQNYRQV